MLNQYGPQRFRHATLRGRDVRIGTLSAGTIVSLPEGRAIIEAWLPREIGAGRKVDGRWQPSYHAHGGHLAQIRWLADGKRARMAYRLLLHAAEA